MFDWRVYRPMKGNALRRKLAVGLLCAVQRACGLVRIVVKLEKFKLLASAVPARQAGTTFKAGTTFRPECLWRVCRRRRLGGNLDRRSGKLDVRDLDRGCAVSWHAGR